MDPIGRSNRYPMVLWDFDGTIADSLGHALRFYNEKAKNHGYRPVLDPDRVRGMTFREFLMAHGVPIRSVPRMLRSFLSEFRRDLYAIPPISGVIECIWRLHRARIRQAIISSNEKSNIRRWLAHHQVADCFETCVGVSRLFGKEKPVKRVVRASQLPVRGVLYVGDEVRDIVSARKAGIDVAAVTWGLNSKEILLEFRPDYLVQRPVDLSDVCIGRS